MLKLRTFIARIMTTLVAFIPAAILCGWYVGYSPLASTLPPTPLNIAIVALLLTTITFLIIHDAWWNNRFDQSHNSHRKNWTTAMLVLVFVTLMSLTTVIVLSIEQRVVSRAHAAFERQVDQLILQAQSRLDQYASVSQGLQGLFAASGEVSGSVWTAYINRLDIEGRYPGITSVSYVRKTTAEGVKKLPFMIRPYDVKEVYYPEIYVTSFQSATQTEPGFDVSSSPTRDLAVQNTINNGLTTATRVSESELQVYTPVYLGAGELGAVGITYAYQKTSADMFKTGNSGIDVSLITSMNSTVTSKLVSNRQVRVADTTLPFRFVADYDAFVGTSERSASSLVFLLGLVLSAFITFGISLSVNRTTPRAPSVKHKKTAKEIVSDLPKLSIPAERALAAAGITVLSDLVRFTEREFKNLHGVGPTTLKSITKAMKEKNISFK